MRILIDILHPADINFYKNAIRILKYQGNEIFVSYMSRGKIKEIIDKEYSEFGLKTKCIGKHHSSKLGKYLGIITREFQLIKFIKKSRFDIVTSFGFYVGIAGHYTGVPSVLFHDDAEYKQQFNLCKKYATRFVIPQSINVEGKNIIKGFDYKELAYLHPKYFKPNKKVLNYYKLKSKEYIFIREIANISLNYNNKDYDLIRIIKEIKSKGFKIVLSLEDKSLKDNYKDDCIILEEPVEDFYSLIYYSKFVVTSGDTIAREAALLGLTVFYTGGRDMLVNKVFLEHGLINMGFDIKKKLSKSLKKGSFFDTTDSIIKNLI